jgi:hypothetical protein
MTAPAAPEPADSHEPAAARQARLTSEEVLITGAARWIHEALDAWVEDDQPKVALMALRRHQR